jgi:hypothetical protein
VSRQLTTATSVIAIGLCVAIVTGCSGQPAATIGPTATASLVTTAPPSAPGPSATEAPEPEETPIPPLTETFSSDMHGITIKYPTSWIPIPATVPWPEGEIVMQESEFGDIIGDGPDGGSAFLALASQPLGERNFEQWASAYLALEGCASSEPITVDGYPGLIGTACTLAFVHADDRVYLIWLYRISDREAFKGILATAELEPDDAVDAA